MRLIWSPQALQDLAQVHAYISRDNPTAADKMTKRIVALVEEQLAAMPNLGRPGRVAGTRELVMSGTPFVVPYRIQGDAIEIARVYHASRKWPGTL